MPYEDYQNLTDADYENLPPLVAKGEDRQAKLAEVVERWATQTAVLFDDDGVLTKDFDRCERHAATLRRIDLRDDNEDANPIDFGLDLLEPLAERVEWFKAEGRPRVCIALLGCRVQVCTSGLAGLWLDTFLALASSFDNAFLEDSVFDGDADFSRAVFNGDAWFGHAEFRKNVNFTAAAFRGSVFFRDSKFNKVANFSHTIFRKQAYLDRSQFSKRVSFFQAKFDNDVDFSGVTCGSAADFRFVTFNGNLDLGEANFGGHTSFSWVTFSELVTFRDAMFSWITVFDYGELRQAAVFETERPLRRWSSARRARLRWTEWLNWQRVRSIGELTALTRVSYVALVAVPLLAGVWEPLRYAIDKWNDFSGWTLPVTMPEGWLLAFLAAFCVVVAQLIYQTTAPELIRETTAEDLVDRENEINRQADGDITDERLRQAIDHLRTAADLMPHRHSAWFVKRERRTVWIPERVDERFTNLMVDEPRPKDAPADWTPTKQVPADQEVDAEDRKRIAIEEGQKARYAIEAFRNRPMAWLSGGLYLLAGWLVLATVLRQLGHVAAASPAGWLEGVVWPLTWGWFITVVGVAWLLATVVGVLIAKDESWGAKVFERVVGRVARWWGRGEEEAPPKGGG